MVKIFAPSTARIDRSLRSVRVIRCPLCVSRRESVDLAGIAEGGFAPEQEKEGRAGEWMRLPVFRVPSQFATHRERFLVMAPSAAAAVAAATSKEVWYEEGRAAIHFP